MLHDRLGGLLDALNEAEEPLDQLSPKPWSTNYGFNQISMSFIWQSTHDLNRPIEIGLKLLGPWAEDVPNWRSKEITVIDVMQFGFGHRMGKVELVINAVVLVNVLNPLLEDIHLTAIDLVADHVGT